MNTIHAAKKMMINVYSNHALSDCSWLHISDRNRKSASSATRQHRYSVPVHWCQLHCVPRQAVVTLVSTSLRPDQVPTLTYQLSVNSRSRSQSAVTNFHTSDMTVTLLILLYIISAGYLVFWASLWIVHIMAIIYGWVKYFSYFTLKIKAMFSKDT